MLIARYDAIANLYAQAATADTAAVGAGPRGLSPTGRPRLSQYSPVRAAVHRAETGRRVFRRPLSDDEARSLRQEASRSRRNSWSTSRARRSSPSPRCCSRRSSCTAPSRFRPARRWAARSPSSRTRWRAACRSSSGRASPTRPCCRRLPPDALATPDAGRRAGRCACSAGRSREARVLWDFHRQWLGLDRILLAEDLTRTPQVDPDWTAATQASASMETQLFVQNTLGGRGHAPRSPDQPPRLDRPGRCPASTASRRRPIGAWARGRALPESRARRAPHAGRRTSPGSHTPERPRRPCAATPSSSASSASCRSRRRPAPISRSPWRRPGRGTADQPHALRDADLARRPATSATPRSMASASASRTTTLPGTGRRPTTACPSTRPARSTGPTSTAPSPAGSPSLQAPLARSEVGPPLRHHRSSFRYGCPGARPVAAELPVVDALAKDFVHERRRRAALARRGRHVAHASRRGWYRTTDVVEDN